MNKKVKDTKDKNIDLESNEIDELASFIERKKIQNDAFKKIIEDLNTTNTNTKKK